MNYVDGFLIAIPTKNLEQYKEMATQGRDTWIKYGALDYYECAADDLKADDQITSFPALINLKPDETIIFAFIIFKSRAHRDEVNKKVMADPEMSPEKWEGKEMPFEMKRMSYGGFQAIVQK